MNARLISFTLLLIITCGCWERKVDGDKHLQLPQFPDHTNDQLRIAELPYKRASGLFKVDNVFVMLCKLDSTNESSALIVLNEDFIEKRRVKINTTEDFMESCAFDERSKTIYVIGDAFGTGKISSYRFPDFKESFARAVNYDSIRDTLRQQGAKQSQESFESGYDRAMYTIIANDYFGDIEYVLNRGCVSILKKKKFTNPEYFLEYCDGSDWLNSDHLDEIMSAQVKVKLKSDSIEVFDSLNLIEFDEAVMGNTSHGNHFIGTIWSFGYKYYHLNMKGDTTSFKMYSDYLTRSLWHILNLKASIILYEEESGTYYRVTHVSSGN